MSYILDDAKEELQGMAKGGLSHPSTKSVLTGAAVGAVAAAVLPFVAGPAGLDVGAGLMFYKRLRP